MSDAGASHRARANHELYLAKLVLAAWSAELQKQQVPASTLAEAFEAGVRDHLRAAYGWFLLTITQSQAQPGGPPGCCEELPPVPAGRVMPAEINEFRQLESSGWLRDMLRADGSAVAVSRRPDNLAFEQGSRPGNEQAAYWLQQLELLFDRMGDAPTEC